MSDISGLKEVEGNVVGESLGPSGANGTPHHRVSHPIVIPWYFLEMVQHKVSSNVNDL